MLGLVDDYLSVKRGKNLGLKARYKLLGQFVIAVLFSVWVYMQSVDGTSAISIGHLSIDFKWLYYVLVVGVMMLLANATNFTDGLDGLLSGTTIFAAVGVASTMAAVGANAPLPGFALALAGASLGFLYYNAHPAKVFMGDTGSLPIGAALTAIAVLGKQEILLLLFSIVFLAEIVSVMIQVTSFKLTKKRVFLMTPIHHHFEKKGWPETVVVARFWIVGVLALVVGLILHPYVTPYGLGR
jgi:phospho-N-acetylmuramoyl-pentapeptide-transferase